MVPPSQARDRLLARALRLQYLTGGYNIAEAVIAILAGLAASSIALLGFGFDSGIEVAASVIIIWRFRAEFGGVGRSHDSERKATRLVGLTLFLLAGYVTHESLQSLAAATIPAASPAGIALAVVSLIVMPFVALRKRRIATELRSGAALAESTQTFICSIFSGLLLVGLLANAIAGWWWADSVAALLMVPFVIREAGRAWSGGLCCEDNDLPIEDSIALRQRRGPAMSLAMIAACFVCGCSDCTDRCRHGTPDRCACSHCKKS